MNIITTLIARVEEARLTTKAPCKNYATERAAEKATAEAARIAGEHFTRSNATPRPARYVVVYVPAWGRWIGALANEQIDQIILDLMLDIDLTWLMERVGMETVDAAEDKGRAALKELGIAQIEATVRESIRTIAEIAVEDRGLTDAEVAAITSWAMSSELWLDSRARLEAYLDGARKKPRRTKR